MLSHLDLKAASHLAVLTKVPRIREVLLQLASFSIPSIPRLLILTNFSVKQQLMKVHLNFLLNYCREFLSTLNSR